MNEILIKDLRLRLHNAAEPSMQETETKQMIMTFLKEHTSLKIIDCGAWFYAVYETDSSDSPIAFRADFDAVLCSDEHARHLCGHDGHSAVLCALALELEKMKPARSVYLIFQPGEETGQGGKLCAGLIKKKQIGEVYAFHNIPSYPENQILLLPGTFACASTGLEMIFQGAPAHAAYPDQGKNPAMIVAELIRYADMLVKNPHKGILLATVIGAEIGSSSYGVSADHAVLRFTIRGEYQEEYDWLVSALQQRAGELSTEEDISYKCRFIETFPSTENDAGRIEKVRHAAETAGLSTAVPAEPFRWSEDFGYYLRETHGAMFGVGAGEEWSGLHTMGYEFNDRLIPTCVSVFKGLI